MRSASMAVSRLWQRRDADLQADDAPDHAAWDPGHEVIHTRREPDLHADSRIHVPTDDDGCISHGCHDGCIKFVGPGYGYGSWNC